MKKYYLYSREDKARLEQITQHIDRVFNMLPLQFEEGIPKQPFTDLRHAADGYLAFLEGKKSASQFSVFASTYDIVPQEGIAFIPTENGILYLEQGKPVSSLKYFFICLNDSSTILPVADEESKRILSEALLSGVLEVNGIDRLKTLMGFKDELFAAAWEDTLAGCALDNLKQYTRIYDKSDTAALTPYKPTGKEKQVALRTGVADSIFSKRSKPNQPEFTGDGDLIFCYDFDDLPEGWEINTQMDAYDNLFFSGACSLIVAFHGAGKIFEARTNPALMDKITHTPVVLRLDDILDQLNYKRKDRARISLAASIDKLSKANISIEQHFSICGKNMTFKRRSKVLLCATLTEDETKMGIVKIEQMPLMLEHAILRGLWWRYDKKALDFSGNRSEGKITTAFILLKEIASMRNTSANARSQTILLDTLAKKAGIDIAPRWKRLDFVKNCHDILTSFKAGKVIQAYSISGKPTKIMIALPGDLLSE